MYSSWWPGLAKSIQRLVHTKKLQQSCAYYGYAFDTMQILQVILIPWTRIRKHWRKLERTKIDCLITIDLIRSAPKLLTTSPIILIQTSG